nr:uncharacterized protein CI109_001738 [Kwoniella shandongensis]KAA5529798.1 hypothetical protein CI109_001738 [Kwoniella shandongensis]
MNRPHSGTSTQRHTYHNATPGAGPSPVSPPPSLPSLLPTDPQDAHSPNSDIVTPISGSAGDDGITTPKMASDHFMLSSYSILPTPKLVIPQQDTSSRGFSLLPPHHPLRSKMQSQQATEGVTPPHTPKGHPLSTSNRSYFSFPNNSQSRSVSNPYEQKNAPYSTTLTYLLRIPRRLRPVLLIGLCVLTFGLVLLNRAMSMANHLEHSMANKQPAAFARRFVEVSGLNDAKGQHPLVVDAAERARLAEALVQSTTKGLDGDRTGLRFEDTKEELAALISFITSTTSNVLPDLDPTVPMNPGVILDFDPAHPNAQHDLELLQNEINTLYPLILFGRMRDPWHREIKRMLAEYKIMPTPLIIDVDQRKDHSIFIPVLSRLLDTTDLPQLVLQGEPLGSYHDILDLREKGILQSTLEASGAMSVSQIKKKKKGGKEKERIENERILGPAPIVESI